MEDIETNKLSLQTTRLKRLGNRQYNVKLCPRFSKMCQSIEDINTNNDVFTPHPRAS